MKHLVALLLFILSLSACNSKNKVATVTTNTTTNKLKELSDLTKYKDFADTVCGCTENLLEIYRQFNQLDEDGQIEQAASYEDRMEREAKQSDQCISEYRRQLILSETTFDQNIADAALREHCPDFYNMLKVGRMK